MYTVDYFIKKFEAIPEDGWNSYSQYDSADNTRCAFGHCATRFRHGNANGTETIEGDALIKIFNAAGYGIGSGNWVTDVNNGRSDQYQQPTPKQRILAALYDIKKLQSPEVKEKIVYVAVPVIITEQAKELVMS